jgi:hypothetical protein
LVEYYSWELSFNTDVVNAFLGIVEAFTDLYGLTATYFYGILLLVCNKTNGARHQTVYLHKNESSFLFILLWTVISGVEHHTPSSKTSHRGPGHRSKADRPSNILGGLEFLHGGDADNYTDVLAQIWHQRTGMMNLEDFPDHPDDCEAFSPWIQVTTWTRKCTVENLGGNFGTIVLEGNRIVIQDEFAALQGAQLHVACLRYSES